MYKTTEHEEYLCTGLVDAVFKVHKELGPGLLEKVYETCVCHELAKKGIKFERQIVVPIYYDGLYFEESLRLDLLIEGLIVCELKAQENINAVWTAQLLSHLKITGKHVGFLINFHVPLIKNGIKRFVLG